MALRHILFGIATPLAAAAGFLAYIGYFNTNPFVVTKPQQMAKPMRSDLGAIFLSGDMGFDLGTSGIVLRQLVADGVPVVGVNSATFFRDRRTPDQIASLIVDSIRRLPTPRTRKILLIGQSFGADMLQAGLPQLSGSVRAQVKAVVLIAPTKTVYFQISPREMLERLPADADGIATGQLLTWVPTLCIHGQNDHGSLCPDLVQPNVVQKPLAGGHLMRKDGKAIYAAVATIL